MAGKIGILRMAERPAGREGQAGAGLRLEALRRRPGADDDVPSVMPKAGAWARLKGDLTHFSGLWRLPQTMAQAVHQGPPLARMVLGLAGVMDRAGKGITQMVDAATDGVQRTWLATAVAGSVPTGLTARPLGDGDGTTRVDPFNGYPADDRPVTRRHFSVSEGQDGGHTSLASAEELAEQGRIEEADVHFQAAIVYYRSGRRGHQEVRLPKALIAYAHFLAHRGRNEQRPDLKILAKQYLDEAFQKYRDLGIEDDEVHAMHIGEVVREIENLLLPQGELALETSR